MPNTRIKTLIIALLVATLGRAVAQDHATFLPTEVHRASAHIDLIKNAKTSIDISYFDLKGDRIGLGLLGLLREKAREGVKVRLIIDDHGSFIPEHILMYLQESGVRIQKFHPMKAPAMTWAAPLSWLWKRSHDKLVVVDGKRMIANTENASEEYYSKLINRGQKNRFVGRGVVIEGEKAPAEAQTYFNKVWESTDTQGISTATLTVPQRAEAGKALDHHYKLAERFARSELVQKEGHQHQPKVQVDNVEFLHNRTATVSDEQQIFDRLIKEIKAAKESVLLDTPYFILTPALKQAIQDALDRGVDVTLKTNAFKNIDQKMAGVVYSVNIEEVAAMGVHVSFYSSKETNHAKTYIFDGYRTFIGSMNMNKRSAEHDREVGVLVDSADFAQATREDIDSRAQKEFCPGLAAPSVRSIIRRALRTLTLDSQI